MLGQFVVRVRDLLEQPGEVGRLALDGRVLGASEQPRLPVQQAGQGRVERP
ncbi:hypothetical protein [Jiangella muralis]|uniref:hypothetical protein n=1 Tax=Jiangella muralis TaxID=702383 RepID=UPI0012F93168|nr:hypothetical protein [Jiangella muralis]